MIKYSSTGRKGWKGEEEEEGAARGGRGDVAGAPYLCATKALGCQLQHMNSVIVLDCNEAK